MEIRWRNLGVENDRRTIPWYAIHKDGVIAGFFGSFSFLSNFYILENGIFVDDICYPSVENAYQCCKWPVDQRDQFLDISPAQAKKLGRRAPKFDSNKWNKMKVEIMSAFCRQKFDKNDNLKKMLEMTEDCLLEERNSWGDIYWGTDVNGVGENNLGKILMTIRSDLQMKKRGDQF